MAIRYAVAAGNWSNPATWDGGASIPASTDDVWPNGFTVTVDQDITVATLRTVANASAPTIAVGGTFSVGAGRTVNVTAPILATYYRATGTGGIITLAGSGIVTINSVAVTAMTNSTSVTSFIDAPTAFTGTLDWTATGIVTGGGGTDGTCLYGSATSGSRTLNVTASAGVVGGASSGGAISTVSSGASGTTVNLTTPTISGGTSKVITFNSGTFNLIGGDVACSNTATTPCVSITGTAVAVFTGSTLRGTSGSQGATSAFGTVEIASAAVATFRNCTFHCGNTANGSSALISNGTGVRIRVSGDIYCGGIVANTGPDGFFPIKGLFTVDSGGDGIRIHIPNDFSFPASNDGNETILSTYGGGHPVVADVRAGTVYGPSANLTGTLNVPPAASVAAGVPVDDTVGTGGVLLADIATVTGAQIAGGLDA